MDVVIVVGFGITVIFFSMLGIQIERQAVKLSQLEDMVKALLDHAGVDFDPNEVVKQRVVEALGRGGNIEAIKQHRKSTGSSLKDAKDFVETLQHTTDSETRNSESAGFDDIAWLAPWNWGGRAGVRI